MRFVSKSNPKSTLLREDAESQIRRFCLGCPTWTIKTTHILWLANLFESIALGLISQSRKTLSRKSGCHDVNTASPTLLPYLMARRFRRCRNRKQTMIMMKTTTNTIPPTTPTTAKSAIRRPEALAVTWSVIQKVTTTFFGRTTKEFLIEFK